MESLLDLLDLLPLIALTRPVSDLGLPVEMREHVIVVGMVHPWDPDAVEWLRLDLLVDALASLEPVAGPCKHVAVDVLRRERHVHVQVGVLEKSEASLVRDAGDEVGDFAEVEVHNIEAH